MTKADVESATATIDAGARAGARAGVGWTRVALIVGFGVVMSVLVTLHTPGLNGPSYFPWRWQDLGVWPWWALLAAGVLPFVAAQLLQRRIVVALLLVMTSTLAIELAAAGVRGKPFGLSPIESVVRSPTQTSYFTAAARMEELDLTLPYIVANYDELIPYFPLHAKTKPPGPILFYTVLIRAVGIERAAMVGGLIIAVLAALVVPATYAFIERFTGDRAAAFCGASCVGLCPGIVLLAPQFDQTFALFTVALCLTWRAAINTARWRYAALLGAIVALMIFITYLPLVIGPFMLAWALWVRRAPVVRVLRMGLIALAVVVACYGAAWWFTAYDPIAAYRSSHAAWLEMFNELEASGVGRHLPYTIPFDLLDFALGSGWIAFPLAATYLATSRRESPFRLALLCVLQIVFVALIGLLQGETARIWSFMLPLLMVPVGLELSRWSLAQRLAAYAALVLAVGVIRQNLSFFF